MTEFEKYLSDEAVAEFDRIVSEYERPARRRKAIRWSSGLAAAAVMTLLAVGTWTNHEDPIPPMEIAEGMRHLMDINSEEILSIEAIPKGSKAILTAKMRDGSIRTFVMTADKDGSSILIALNEND